MPAKASTAVRTLGGRNRTKPVVHLHDEPYVAIKDYGVLPPWLRMSWGRALARREARALERAAAVEGVPRLIEMRGRYRLVLERVDGTPLADWTEPPPASAAARLAAIVEALHRAGVAHGDLHHRDVLIDADGTVHVVDLATALLDGQPGWERWARRDRAAVARLSARIRGESGEGWLAALPAADAAAWRRRRVWRRRWDRLRGRR